MDVIYENDRVKVAERIGNLGNSCSADIRYTHRLQSKSGRVVWVDTILHNICDAHGEPVELLSISRDITQQKKNEDSIRLFSNLISEAEDAIVITDKAASILFVNNEAALMFGFTSNEMLNLKFYDIDQYVNDDQKWERYLSEAIDNGKLLEEQNFLLASGKCIPVERKSQYSEIDGTGYVIIIIDDISDRKIQESKLRRDVEKQQILSDIAFLLNTSSDFEFKTREAVRIIGNYLQLSRISIFQDILNGKAVSNTIEWCNKGIETQRLNLQAIPYSMFPEWKDKLINDNIIEISGIFNAGSEIASAFKPFEFSSLLIFPLLLENGFTGFICFVENKKTRIWKESEKSFLSTFTQIITNAFEQKQLIDALRKSEKRFREFAELLPEMVFETNINGKITFVNRQAQLRFGIGADEMLKGLIFFNLFAERDKLKAWDNFEKRIRGTSIDNEEYSLIARDNTEIPVLLYFNLIMRDNMAIGIRAVLTDISERKVIEQQNQSLAKLPEESPYPILRMEADGNVSYSNKKGADIRHFIISNFDIYFKPLFDEIASSKQTEEIEVLIDDVFYSLAIVPVPQHNYINIYAKDITQKKRDEEKLMLSEQRFRDVAGAAGEFIWETNETFFITYVSDKVREVLGYEPFELLGKNIGVLVPQKERKTLIQTLQTFAQNGQSIVNEELVAVSKQGKLKWLTSSGIPIFDASKNFIGFRGTGMDINNRKRYEKELYNAKHEAEKASAIKAEFLSTMSHEIRTPMNAVIGLTHILLQDETRPDQLETLNTLKFSAENLLVLLNDILDFSKIESGKISFEDIDFNLHYLINSTRNAFRPLADEKGIDIKVSLPENLKYLKGDPVRLAQILNNLVSNAVKFTESGAVSINVETSAIVAEHIDLFVAISDTGIGIESDQLERIFESFTQASSDISRKFGGTGLGLAISRRLVEMMGGRLEVESVVGKGSKFSFYLRFAMGKTIHESSADSLFSEKFDSLQGLRVLIVEDNLINQVVARKFLEKWDVAFGIADDGEKALAMLENETFDLVLMDIQMPVLDGYETTRRIRKSEKPATANVPVIALTASVLLDVQTKIATAGMNDFLIKPYNPNELYSIIRKYTKH